MEEQLLKDIFIALGKIQGSTEATEKHLSALNGSVKDLYQKSESNKSDIDRMKGGLTVVLAGWGLIVTGVGWIINHFWK